MSNSNINTIVEQSHQAWKTYKNGDINKRKELLDAIADEIEGLGDLLIKTAMKESNLPEGRLIGERGRTCGQLRKFGNHILAGSWLNASIDHAIPDRKPMPKVDIRKMNHALGPIVVFGASNFPLAFSTAGGDTASALAAGCTVIVKAHPAHLETSKLVAGAISTALEKTGFDQNVFQHVEGVSFSIGQALVQHPKVSGVGFTGSLTGGNALLKYASEREAPIPVFAEMSSINPMLILSDKFDDALSARATGLANTIALGVGQFCTKPGLILMVKGEVLDSFALALSEAISKVSVAAMLHEGIGKTYVDKLSAVLARKDVHLCGINTDENRPGTAAVAKVDSSVFKANPDLHEEIFGPYSLIVECQNLEDLMEVYGKLEGQLTSTVVVDPDKLTDYQYIIEEMEMKAGRLIINGVPNGVEVCNSMVHGGPYPATTDGRFTSVGQEAIMRWVRPVCYQAFPHDALPIALRDDNPLDIWRLEDGVMKK